MTIDHCSAVTRTGANGEPTLRIVAVVLLAVVALTACSDGGRTYGPYRRPISESVRMARAGVRDTVLLRRARMLDSMIASESGDSLIKLYVGAMHAAPGEGPKYAAAISCENDRILRRVGAFAGSRVMDRVTDSLFSDPVRDSAFSAATRYWPEVYESGVCSTSDIRQLPESLNWKPDRFPRKK